MPLHEILIKRVDDEPAIQAAALAEVREDLGSEGYFRDESQWLYREDEYSDMAGIAVRRVLYRYVEQVKDDRGATGSRSFVAKLFSEVFEYDNHELWANVGEHYRSLVSRSA